MPIIPSLLAGLMLSGPLNSPLPARAENRIVQPVTDGQMSRVQGSVHPRVSAEGDQGRVDGRTRLRGVSLVFKASPAQQSALEALLQEQQDRSSPGYHQWLTPEQYADRFGLAPEDLGKVAAWLRSKGLTIEDTSRGRTRISFSGTVAQLESAFHTEVHHYLVDGERHLASASEISVPTALSPVVLGVRNLDDFRPRPRARIRKVPSSPEFTSSISGQHFLTPADFAAIYGVGPLYAAGLDGTGQTIAVVGQSALDPNDVAAFRSASHLPASAPQLLLVPGSGSSVVSPGDVEEANLDVQWSGGVAPNAKIVYVYTGDNPTSSVWDAIFYAVDHAVAPVISISYGACEANLGSANAQIAQRAAQQAAAQGQTVSAASGDQGAADCDSRTASAATQGLAVDVPASIPEVTGVGGTEFVGDVTSPSTYWSSVNGSGNGSSLGYIPEGVWNDTAAAGSLAASGGGASAFFTKPSWQTGQGVPGDGKRDVPDVSLNASPVHDGYLTCSQGSCVNGFRDASNGLNVVGGTSAGAPAFAGILAILNQATNSGGLGNVNVRLYELATAAPGAFHPIASGGNAVPCAQGSPDCSAIPPFQLGFAASTGYNRATGLGSVDAQALVTAWTGSSSAPPPAPTLATTSTSLTSSSPSAPSGTPVTFTATVTSGAITAPVTGTVQLLADGAPLGPPAELSGGAAVVQTSALADGAHAIVASYSGDAHHLPSASSPTTQNVTDFALSSSPGTLSLSAGRGGTATLSIRPLGGFAGTVSLTCTTSQLGCSVSPTLVAFDGSTVDATATLTISTVQPPGGATSTASRLGPHGGAGHRALGAGALLATALLLPLRSRRRRSTVLLGLMLLVPVAAVGCGGGGSAPGPSSTPKEVGLPAGSYSLTVTAAGTDGVGLSHAITVVVNVG